MINKHYSKNRWGFVRFCCACKYVAVLFFLVSCTGKVARNANEPYLKIFPSPPDTARIQFLTSISNSIDITGEQSWFNSYVLGEDEGKSIIKPYGIAVSGSKIYICDTMLGGLEIIDLDKNTFDYFVPGGEGKLKKPINCFVDKESLLYVADSERRQVVQFDKTGNFKKAIGNPEFIKPTDVIVDGDNIYIADVENHQIKVFSKNSAEGISLSRYVDSI